MPEPFEHADTDLLNGRREFEDAYVILSKALSEDILRRIHGEVRAMKVLLSREETETLYLRMPKFIGREGREPNLNSPNDRAVRLAEALAFLGGLARQRR